MCSKDEIHTSVYFQIELLSGPKWLDQNVAFAEVQVYFVNVFSELVFTNKLRSGLDLNRPFSQSVMISVIRLTSISYYSYGVLGYDAVLFGI
jgi:hypothetical protein